MFTMATMIQGEWGTVETMTVGKCALGYRESNLATDRAIERARESGKAVKVLSVSPTGRYGEYQTVLPDGRVINETF